jgi:hypothetical protein
LVAVCFLVFTFPPEPKKKWRARIKKGTNKWAGPPIQATEGGRAYL